MPTCIAIGREIATGRSIAVGREIAAIVYLLGPFTFSNNEAAPMASPHVESGAVGALTVVDASGIISASGGVAAVNGTPAATSGWHSPAQIARVVGRALLCRIVSRATIGTNARFGIAPTNSGGSDLDVGVDYSTTSSVRIKTGVAVLDTVNIGSDEHHFVFVMRTAGGFLLARNGASGTYTLLWVYPSGTGGQYAKMYLASGAAQNFQTDDWRVTDLPAPWNTDYGIALHHSTFTAANGTALTALTPEIGGAWTARNGTFDVQSNRAVASGAAPSSPTMWVATVESSLADCIIECTLRYSATGEAGDCSLVFRYSDNSNFWIAHFVTGTNSFAIFEYNAGVFTQRASVTVSAATNTDFRVVVICEGSTITAFVNNGNRISYALATHNQTATKHGIRANGTSSSFDNFAVYPRTLSGPALAALDGV